MRADIEPIVGRDGVARNETQLERCDRNLVELLQEVRAVQTGVQVLFAFLLTARWPLASLGCFRRRRDRPPVPAGIDARRCGARNIGSHGSGAGRYGCARTYLPHAPPALS